MHIPMEELACSSPSLKSPQRSQSGLRRHSVTHYPGSAPPPPTLRPISKLLSYLPTLHYHIPTYIPPPPPPLPPLLRHGIHTLMAAQCLCMQRTTQYIPSRHQPCGGRNQTNRRWGLLFSNLGGGGGGGGGLK